MTELSALTRYRRAVAAVLDERGPYCECCGEPSRYCHHIIPVSETGIAAALVYEPANLMVICADCHSRMHPGTRHRNMWWKYSEVKASRGRQISRS
jgi:5-methylcytosine-specific restriction endonuclease McrA